MYVRGAQDTPKKMIFYDMAPICTFFLIASLMGVTDVASELENNSHHTHATHTHTTRTQARPINYTRHTRFEV
jgi:hypothetical protein